HMQFARPPAFAREVRNTLECFADNRRRAVAAHELPAREAILRTAFDFVSVTAGLKLQFRLAGKNKMVAKERKLLRLDGLAGAVLEVDAAGNGLARRGVGDLQASPDGCADGHAHTCRQRASDCCQSHEGACGGCWNGT